MEIMKRDESKEWLNGHLLNFKPKIQLCNLAARRAYYFNIFLPLSVVKSLLSITVSICIVIGKQMENCSSAKLSHLSF